jgi:NADH-quinone oxidoreductase subunit I
MMASLWRRVWNTAKSIVVGHAITGKELVSKPITVLYPEEKPEFPTGSRAVPTLKVNEESGLLNCTSCGLCERTCPPGCIEIVQATDPATGKRRPYPQSYELDLSHCMVCNLCVEACPFDALEMLDVVELSTYQVQDLKFNKQQLIDLWKTGKAIRIAEGQVMPS